MPTAIEWCDETFNPWWGCDRVSPACAHCYADDWAARFGMKLWGDGHEFRFFGDKHWAEPLTWARTLPAKLGRRPRIFCASMADVFEERDELEQPRVRLFDLIEKTPELDWLILTKRPEFMREWILRRCGILNHAAAYFPDVGAQDVPDANLWLGVSIENARYTWRADVLREVPAAVRFISAEPLLASLFETDYGPCRGCGAWLTPGDFRRGHCAVCYINGGEGVFKRKRALDLSGIDWVIIGGESGPKTRPFHLEHAREIISAARDCDCGSHPCGHVPAVFVKQLGAKPVMGLHRIVRNEDQGVVREHALELADRKGGGDMDEWPADLRIREFPRSAVPA